MKVFIVSYHQEGFFHDAIDPESPTMELIPWIESDIVLASNKNDAIREFRKRNSFYANTRIVGVCSAA
jgi:hypothetical protein